MLEFGMRFPIAVAFALILASMPIRGIGYHNHIGWTKVWRIDVPNGQLLSSMRRFRMPICLHMDWPTMKVQPVPMPKAPTVPGSILA